MSQSILQSFSLNAALCWWYMSGHSQWCNGLLHGNGLHDWRQYVSSCLNSCTLTWDPGYWGKYKDSMTICVGKDINTFHSEICKVIIDLVPINYGLSAAHVKTLADRLAMIKGKASVLAHKFSFLQRPCYRTCRNRSIDTRVIYYTYFSRSNLVMSWW